MSRHNPTSPGSVRLAHLFTLRLQMRRINELGNTPYGRRRIVDLDEGSFEGERLRGVVRSSGADSALVRSDGVFVPDVSLILETQDQALIRMQYTGRWSADEGHLERLLRREGNLSDGNSVLRVAGLFETAAPDYLYLNRVVGLGVGTVTDVGIDYNFFEAQ